MNLQKARISHELFLLKEQLAALYLSHTSISKPAP